MTVVEAVDANSINTGLEFTPEGIAFTGFPLTEKANEIKAYMDLASRMNKHSMERKRINITLSETDNEKYAFRAWLNRIGMIGKEYKETRRHLLDNLPGNSAFRTEEQAEAFREKYRKHTEVEA